MNRKTDPYVEKLKQLEAQREEWLAHWREIAEFLLPRKGLFPGERPNQGDKRHTRILDGRPTKALRNLAAMMQSGLTSPARPWFRIGLADPGASERAAVREWLGAVERAMYQAFARSNFYECVHSLYTELAGFGTGVMFVEEDPARRLRCRVLTAGTYSAAADASGRIDTIFRRFPMTARQMVERFGHENVSSAVRERAEKTPFDYFEVVQAVQPRPEVEAGRRDKRGKPFESVYFEYAESERFLEESGFDEFPFLAPRWDVSGGDVYGRSPGMDVLADVKMLNEVARSLLKAVHKEIDPPMLVPPGFKDRLNLLPGAINYGDGIHNDSIRPLYQVRLNLEAAQAVKNDVLSSIREGFFNDLFVFLMQRPGVTATEVVERHEEKLLLLGPVIERQQSELLDPLIDRVFGVLGRSGALPEPPPELLGGELKIEYISLLSQAQKLVGTKSVQSMIGFIGGAAQANPEVLDKIDLDRAVDVYAEMLGVPPKVIRSDEEVQKLRAARAEKSRQQEASAALFQTIQGAKTLSETNLGESNALAALTGTKNPADGNLPQ
jgi:hypothetical protein